MNTHLIFAPVLPSWVMVIAILISLILGGLSIWHSPRSSIFRILALVTLLAVLANPRLQTDAQTPLDDIVLILIDESSSQQLDNRAQIANLITSRIKPRIEQLGDIEMREITIQGEQETRLLDSTRNAVADIAHDQLAAVFIITDGQATDILIDDEGVAQLGNGDAFLPEGIPLHVILTGRKDEYDRRISLINAPRYGIVRESVRVSFRIEDIGPDEIALDNPVNVPVTLKVDGREILSQGVPIGKNVGFDVPLERPGQLIIELAVASKDGELSTKNNSVVLPITAVRDRLRVLLISGEPNPGARVWRNLLKSDPSIDLVHFTILRTAEKFDSAPSSELALIPFPTRELFIEKLKEFDLIIFDRYTWRNVLKSYHFDNIARFVEEGGAMLVASGPEFNGRLSLAGRRTISWLLPATPKEGTIDGPYRPILTDEGKRHPVTADLPEQGFWGRWLRAIPTTLRQGTALMSGPQDIPLLILDRVGDGRIGMIQSDHIWLWSRGFDGGGPHAELLRRTAHWLMKEPQLEEERLTLVERDNSLTIERRTLSDQPSSTNLTLPDGSERDIEMTQISSGLYRATVEDLAPGLYRAAADDLFAIGAIGIAAAPEYQNIISESRKLRPLAQSSGGEVFHPRGQGNTIRLPALRRLRANIGEKAPRSGPGWAGIVRNEAVQIDGRRSAPLTSPWVWLALLALWIALAWAIESKPALVKSDS